VKERCRCSPAFLLPRVWISGSALCKTLLWKLLMRERPNIAPRVVRLSRGSCITIRDVFNLSAFVLSRRGSFSLAHAAAAAAHLKPSQRINDSLWTRSKHMLFFSRMLSYHQKIYNIICPPKCMFHFANDNISACAKRGQIN
jgi:hypothetical protein